MLYKIFPYAIGSFIAGVVGSLFIALPKIHHLKENLNTCNHQLSTNRAQMVEIQQEHQKLLKECTIKNRELKLQLERVIKQAQRQPIYIPKPEVIPKDELEECRLMKEMLEKAIGN